MLAPLAMLKGGYNRPVTLIETGKIFVMSELPNEKNPQSIVFAQAFGLGDLSQVCVSMMSPAALAATAHRLSRAGPFASWRWAN